MKLKLILLLFIFCAGCAGGIQKSYWDANTSVAMDNERKGNYQETENDYKRALWRARTHLGPKEVSESLYSIGIFYARQQRGPEAISHLHESLTVEESLTGKSSDRTGRRMAALAAAYLKNGDIDKARTLVERLKPLLHLYSGEEQEYVGRVINEFNKDPELYKSEISRLMPLAEKGDPEALYNLAGYYEEGRGVAQNSQKAFELYEMAAKKEYLSAQYYLGVIYDKGRGVQPDHVKARYWYRIAAERGLAMAQYNYAIYLLRGIGGAENREEAVKWLKNSSNQGFNAATSLLKSLKN